MAVKRLSQVTCMLENIFDALTTTTQINRCIFLWQGVQRSLPRSCTSRLNPILVTTITVIQDCKIIQLVQSNYNFVASEEIYL